jgi:hypothetical protein
VIAVCVKGYVPPAPLDEAILALVAAGRPKFDDEKAQQQALATATQEG